MCASTTCNCCSSWKFAGIEWNPWRNALNELISSTNEVTAAESEVFERLKFSYSRLGDEVLQDCFLYCSLYPEDHDIPAIELIEYWIAEGLIAEMNSVEAKFDKGHAILGKLTSSCLLESFTDEDGEEWLSMHDLIRDMALRITTSGPRFMVKALARVESVPDEDWSEDLNRISFMFSRIKQFPIRPPLCPRLTTLLLSYNYLSKIPDSFFTNMQCLNILDLSWNNMRSLPESIFCLEKLHALILANCSQLEYVPSLEKLKALKVFKLTFSQIEVLPEGIEELVNLRKLNLRNNERLGIFPSCKLRRLLKLQYLRTDGTRVKVSAEDLLCLRQLKVVAVHFDNVQVLNRYLTSQHCQGLEKYLLLVGEKIAGKDLIGKEVCIVSESEPFGTGVNQLVLPTNIGVLQLHGVHDLMSLSAILSLKDARQLCRCDVTCCNGLESIFSSVSFSEDGKISLETVESLSLSDLPSCRVLFDGISPPHNVSFNLKQLSLLNCHIMKNIFPVHFLQNFPNLQALTVAKCENMEDIIVEKGQIIDRGHDRDDSNTISLPELQRLSLRGLPRLKSIYNGVMVCQSIEVVNVENCPMVRRKPLSLDMDSKQATSPPSLRLITGDKEWWESLEWDDPLTKTILQPFLNRDLRLEPDDEGSRHFNRIARLWK